jgi:hypothetical protein
MKFTVKETNPIMSNLAYSQFRRFLQEELSLPQESIAMAERAIRTDGIHLPMILWQYGLVTLEQLDKIYDFLEEVV